MSWWEEQTLENYSGLRWRVGPLGVELFRRPLEWRIAWRSDPVSEPNLESVTRFSSDNDFAPGAATSRYIVQATSRNVRLHPRMPDRNMVIRPQEPFFLPSNEQTTLFVTCPVWVEISVDTGRRRLLEVPALRPSDTWFGPSTREGELCYDTRIRGVLHADQLQHRPHRVVTPLIIRNRASSHLNLERISLPAPLLSIYADHSGRLWSEAVTLLREEDGEYAELQISKVAPSQANRAVRISDPRRKVSSGMLVRAFGGLFS